MIECWWLIPTFVLGTGAGFITCVIFVIGHDDEH